MKKLTIVDDEQEIVDFLRMFFEERGGYEISIATSPDEAISVIERNQPDVVLLDLRMRGNKSSGFEVLTATKRISPKTKVIMVTAVEDHYSVQEALRLGAVDYITKPLSLEYLETSVIEKLKEASKS